ncbi:multiple epidermal growth factor-like domains protein 11 [Saccostrea echinata]|uniref:multiple epidermal growth factor-like domains protein 11 n=1 Tax=Saccostrea echinata TaxID=191078 RepID=UPI002A829403|nr:multiple epidermal growth factor-like domains protein 11 [Saccostrea echinata]
MNEGLVPVYFLGGLIFIGNVSSAYENIALEKHAWQLHPYTGQAWGADKAVDGRYSDRSAGGGQCAINANYKINAEWWVYLGQLLSIHHITIYYRTDNVVWDETNGYTSRFLGFSVYISNTTKKEEGRLCFKDTNYTKSTIPDMITIECLFHGRYVIYYNERLSGSTYPNGYSMFAHNELCEFQVYGCPVSGFYGKNCSLPCPQNCQERHCNIVDGTCLGCITGYKGSRCEEQCDNNKYGLGCNLTCGNCSNGEQCNHVSGSCPNGCDAGAQGDTCNEGCPFGRHGKNCVEVCNPNCKGGCNRFTGVCEYGCYPGWKGTFCEIECDGRAFGQDCGQSCGSCLNLEQCHHINGTCFFGCDRGYQGEKCIEECPDGRYGYNCLEMCNINCGDPIRCDRKTGQCQNGCQTGWKDTKCEKECDLGKFGLNCAQSCGVCYEKEQCHHINGTCLNGCDKGYQGINCTQECRLGFHGYGCNETCSTDCFNKTCDATTGECLLIQTPDPPEINIAPIIGGGVAATIVSLTVVIFVIVVRRKKESKRRNSQEKIDTQLSSEHATPNIYIYDNIDENGEYQELRKVGRRTGMCDKFEDKGGYEELGQIKLPPRYKSHVHKY